jgi:hypothetical protein
VLTIATLQAVVLQHAEAAGPDTEMTVSRCLRTHLQTVRLWPWWYITTRCRT